VFVIADACGVLRYMSPSAAKVLTLTIGNVLTLGRLHAPPRLEDGEVEPRAALAPAARLICGERAVWACACCFADEDEALEALPERERGDRQQVTLCLENVLLITAHMLGWHHPDTPPCVDVLDVAGTCISLRLIELGFKLSGGECESLMAPLHVRHCQE